MMRYDLWILTFTLLAFPLSEVRAERKTETYENGSRKAVYYTNSAGERYGSYREYWPDGTKKVIAKYRAGKLDGSYSEYDENGSPLILAKYTDGLLHGLRKRYQDGKAAFVETWVHGFLAFPKSKAEIQQKLEEVRKSSAELAGAEIEARVALLRLREYRCAVGLPWEELVLDRDFNKKCKSATILLLKGGRGDNPHRIDKNPGVPADLFRLGQEGARRSNLHFGQSDIRHAVDGFMRDSDSRNIAELGHRRWCLNPSMGKTGFGRSEGYVAMWAMDRSAKKVPEWDWIAFPPRGLLPVDLFAAGNAWHVSVNSAAFERPSQQEVRVSVRHVKNITMKRSKLLSIRPLKLDHFSVGSSKYGSGRAIIFRPTGIQVLPGESFYVEIDGVKKRDGEAFYFHKIEYFVSFF